MRILMLSPYPPYPPRSGGALRIYNILLGLTKNHEVWFLTFAPDEASVRAMEPLREYCQLIPVVEQHHRSLSQRAWTTIASPLPDMALRNLSSAYTSTLRQILGRTPFDVVQAESIEMARYGLLARKFAKHDHLLLLDEFNAEYVLQQRAAITDFSNLVTTPYPHQAKYLLSVLYSFIQWQKLAAYERQLLQKYDHVIAVSEEDRQALLSLSAQTTITIVPNGVDTTYFSPEKFADWQPKSVGTKNIVFTGTLNFRPNIDAVVWFAQQVFPIVRLHCPEARFLIVGRHPVPAITALQHDISVDVIGEVNDVRPFIATSYCYVVPMRMGGGIRLKLLEALAMEKPVVSTSMGAEGIPELIHGKHLWLANTPETFAHAILLSLDTYPQMQKMAQSGRQLVKERYDWHVIVPRLEQAYRAT